MRIIRQGDILLKEIPGIPENRRNEIQWKTSRIIAEGEITGHNHELTGGRVGVVEGWRGNSMYAVINDEGPEVILQHPEHGHLQIEPGVYEVIRQREYDEGLTRQVRD